MISRRHTQQPKKQAKPAAVPEDREHWDLVDESSWESFPASDPPSWTASSADDIHVHPSTPDATEDPGETQRRGGKSRKMTQKPDETRH